MEQENSNLHTLSKTIQFGEELLEDLAQEENLEIEHKIVIALYRKLLEQLDGNYILADHKMDSPSTVMIRAALETYLAIKYILQEKRRIRDRACCYYIGYLKSQEKTANDFIQKPIKEMHQEVLKHKKQQAEEILNKPIFKKIIDEWERTKKASKSNFEPKWYSLFNGPKTLKQLVDRLGDTEDYRFYGLLSMEAHGYQAINGLGSVNIVDDPFVLKPIRSNFKDEGFNEEIARSLLNYATHKIVQHLFPKYQQRFIELGKEIGLVPKNYPYKVNLK